MVIKANKSNGKLFSSILLVEGFCSAVEAGDVPDSECLEFIGKALKKALDKNEKLPLGYKRRSEEIGALLTKELGIINRPGKPSEDMFGRDYDIALHYIEQLKKVESGELKYKYQAKDITSKKFGIDSRWVLTKYKKCKSVISLNARHKKMNETINVMLTDIVDLVDDIINKKCLPIKNNIEFLIDGNVLYIKPLRNNKIDNLVNSGVSIKADDIRNYELIDWLFSNAVYESINKRNSVGESVICSALKFSDGVKFIKLFISLYKNNGAF